MPARRPVRVKKEPAVAVETQDEMQVDGNHHIRPETLSNSIHIDDDDDDDDDDEIVREMDVYLSPQLSHSLHLLQFPLQQFPSGVPPGMSHNIAAEPPLPAAARYKPRHNMLELDQPIPSTEFMEQQGLKYLQQRTYASHTVPVTTHMAVGKFVPDTPVDDNDDNPKLSLHLIPIHHITQMRPTFTHIDNDDPNNTTLEEEQALAAATAQSSADASKEVRKPLMFQKKESERAATARKSSYAYKKSSEEAEEWVSLQVGEDPARFVEQRAMGNGVVGDDKWDLWQNQIACPVEYRDQTVLDVSATPVATGDGDTDAMEGILGDASGGDVKTPSKAITLSSYVRSLAYMPCPGGTYDRGPVILSSKDTGSSGDAGGGDDEDAERGGRTAMFLVDWKQNGWDENETLELPAIVAHLTTFLCGGWPIPFSILRETLPPSVSEKDMLTALSSCAVMVNGNYVIQSRLLQLPKSVTKARTFMLLLLQYLGIIRRGRLDRALGIENTGNANNNSGIKKEVGHENDETNENILPDSDLTEESIFMMLDQMARKTPDGWVLKVEKDANFLTKFPENTELHMQYWGRQMMRFQDHLQRYALATDV